MRLFLLSLLFSTSLCAQTNIIVTNPIAESIMAGNYNPLNYNAGITTLSSSQIVDKLYEDISPDSLQNYVQTLAAFGTRNSYTIANNSTTKGLKATNNWVEKKFQEFNLTQNNRLIISRMNFNAVIGRCSNVSSTYNQVFAVLPGTDITDKSIILIQGHIDSYNGNSCDTVGIAPGVTDNATGSALVLESARVLSKIGFKSTIVFLLTVGEEQGLWGGKAFANYSSSKARKIKMVLTNDISGASYCGSCSATPSCVQGVDGTNSLRIFSYGSVASIQKQLARYIKLQHKELVQPKLTSPFTINILSGEDRTGRGSDHIPFRQLGYPAIRIISQNENGDGSGTCGVQHTSKDAELLDTNNDGIFDTTGLDYPYLAKNVLINSTAAAMAAQAVKPVTSFTAKFNNPNKVNLVINDPNNTLKYRVAIRSLTNDWDSVYTVTTKTPSLTIQLSRSKIIYISVAAVNADNVESMFTNEISLKVPAATVALRSSYSNESPVNFIDDNSKDLKPNVGFIENYPNPFDESTYIVFKNETNEVIKNAHIRIRKMNGEQISHKNITIVKGLNEYLFSFESLTNAQILFCTIEADNKVIATRKLIFRGR
jgi:hypothetical protein